MGIVLIVDDEGPIADVLTELVHDAGHTAIIATNGHEALALAHSHRPALIISDLIMPLMDGYALVQALRANPMLIDITVVLMSAGTRPAQLPPKTMFLLKPLNLELIISLLQRLPVSHRFGTDPINE